jgi:uncharacterized protein YdeI (YjbR/CyaY-like superfamily)
MEPRYFDTPNRFRAWLEKNHESETELLVGFWKKGSDKPSMTWPESVDEALCFGWIDGVRRSLGAEAYSIRFTPRRAASIWSAVNVAKVAALEEAGKMRPAGVRAFAARSSERTAIYSFERKEDATLSHEEHAALRSDAKAASFFDSCPAWYRRTVLHWVVSAKRSETRAKRFATLKEDCAAGRTVKHLTRATGNAPPSVPAAPKLPKKR